MAPAHLLTGLAATVAIGAAIRLAIGTLATCAIHLGARSPGWARLGAWAPRALRRGAEVALVGSCVVGGALPASASAPAPAVARDQPVVRAAHKEPAPAPSRVATRVTRTPTTYTVQRGDNLWLIASRTLAGHARGAPSDDAVARYWRALMAANRSTLRSGDPSLIYPGEIVALPPVP